MNVGSHGSAIKEFQARISESIKPNDPLYFELLNRLANVLSSTSEPVAIFLTRALAFEIKCVTGIGVFVLPNRLAPHHMRAFGPLEKSMVSASAFAVYELLQKLLYLIYYKCGKKYEVTPQMIRQTFSSFIERSVNNAAYLTMYYTAKKIITAQPEDIGIMIAAMATFVSVYAPPLLVSIPSDILKRLRYAYGLCKRDQHSIANTRDLEGFDSYDREPEKIPLLINITERKPLQQIDTQNIVYFLLLTFYFLVSKYDHTVERSLESVKNEYAVSAILSLISFLITFFLYG
jgi:hypothetical protein